MYDYRNQLTAVGNGLRTTTFTYDYLGNRIRPQARAIRTTVFPTNFYNAIIGGAATTTKQIFFE